MSKKLKHDEIIRSAFENPMVAKEFFQMHLPSHIQSLVSFKTLKMEQDSFVDKTLKKSILDILFSVKFDSEDGHVFLLLEHQVNLIIIWLFACLSPCSTLPNII